MTKYNKKSLDSIKTRIKKIIDKFFKYERVNHENLRELEKLIRQEITQPEGQSKPEQKQPA